MKNKLLILSIISILEFITIIILSGLLIINFNSNKTDIYFYNLSDANFLEKKCLDNNLEIYECNSNSIFISFKNDVSNGEGYYFQGKEKYILVAENFNLKSGKIALDFKVYKYTENELSFYKNLNKIEVEISENTSELYLSPDFISKFDLKNTTTNKSRIRNNYNLKIINFNQVKVTNL